MNQCLAFCIYLAVVFAVAFAFGQIFRRQEERRRGPYTFCRGCGLGEVCKATSPDRCLQYRILAGMREIKPIPDNGTGVEDDVREVLDDIPYFEDL